MEIWLISSKNITAWLVKTGMKLFCIKNGLDIPKEIFNHAMIYDPDTDLVYEAGFPKVVCISQSEWLNKKKNKKALIKVIRLNISDRQKRTMLSYLSVQVGKEYELSNFLWHTLKIFTGKWRGNVDDKQHYCYELVIRALNSIWPSHFYEYLNPFEFNTMAKKNSYLANVSKQL